MTTETVLITGAGSGIGRACALHLARAGYDVVATGRTLQSVETLRGLDALMLDTCQLDVTDQASMSARLDAILARHGGLHALILNAGIACLSVFEVESMEEFREMMEVNLFRPIALTKLALPALRESHGRLLALSSVGGLVGQPFNEAYCTSKFALEGVFETLALVARQVGVQVSLINPGPVATNLTAHLDVQAAIAAAGPYREILQLFFDTASRPSPPVKTLFGTVQTPQEIAELVLSVLKEPHPRLRYLSSKSAEDFVSIKLADTTGTALQDVLESWIGDR